MTGTGLGMPPDLGMKTIRVPLGVVGTIISKFWRGRRVNYEAYYYSYNMGRWITGQFMRIFAFFYSILGDSSISTGSGYINRLCVVPFGRFLVMIVRRLLMILCTIARALVDKMCVRAYAGQLMRRICRVRNSYMLVGVRIRFFMLRNFLTAMFIRRLITMFGHAFNRGRATLLLVIVSVNLGA